MLTHVTRSCPSASTAISATSVESIPPGEADHDVLEAVLVDVVARAEHERRVHLGLRLQHRGDLAAGAGSSRALGRASVPAWRTSGSAW